MEDYQSWNNIQLLQNELKQGVIERLATDPVSPRGGQLWFNTAEGLFKYYDDTLNLPIPLGKVTSRTVSSDYTVQYTDEVVELVGANPLTITLFPGAQQLRLLTIDNESDRNVTIIPAAGETIEGETSFMFEFKFAHTFAYVNGDWKVVIRKTRSSRFERIIETEDDLFNYLAQPNALDYVYKISGRVRFTQSVPVPYEGFLKNLTFNGDGNNFSEIYTDVPGVTIFTGDGITTGGNLFFNNIRMSCTAVGSKLFDITDADPIGLSAVEFVNINFENVVNIGNLNGFRQGLILNGFYFNVQQGFLFQGTWLGGFRVSESRLLATVGCPYNFKSDVGHSFGSRFLSNANVTLDAATIGYDFRPDSFVNDGDFQLLGAQFDGAGTPVTLPGNGGLDGSNRKSLWKDCRGVRNTYEGVVFENTTLTTTTIANTGVWAELVIINDVIETAWFQSNSAGFFHAQYISTLPIYLRLDLSVALQSSNNNALQIEIRKYDSTNTTFEVLKRENLTSNGGTLGTRVDPVTVIKVTPTPILENERLRIFVRNNSQASDIVCEAGASLIVSRR